MEEVSKGYIKVNLPLTEQEYCSGNGEGVWVRVSDETRQAYDANVSGGGYTGVLSNDSVYYPGLMCGTVISFELRGEYRPVADFYGFLAGRPHLTPEGKAAFIRKIAQAQNGGDGA